MEGFNTASRETPVLQSYGSKLFHCCDFKVAKGIWKTASQVRQFYFARYRMLKR
jgi:hypothetical protein